MDIDSSAWMNALEGSRAERNAALGILHEMLLRAAIREAYRRAPARFGGQELDDLAHQAANDAMVALLGKLGSFRGESRFTTWAYRFVMLEVSNKVRRHFWSRPGLPLDAADCERLPERASSDPLAHAQHQELVAAVQRAVDETLTDHQRDLFVAIVLKGVALEAMVSRSGSSRGAIYKTVFDARQKIRAYLIANGYLEHALTDAESLTGR
jgi:RNA polymerase sigma-70 factor (ECF subfamily)